VCFPGPRQRVNEFYALPAAFCSSVLLVFRNKANACHVPKLNTLQATSVNVKHGLSNLGLTNRKKEQNRCYRAHLYDAQEPTVSSIILLLLHLSAQESELIQRMYGCPMHLCLITQGMCKRARINHRCTTGFV